MADFYAAGPCDLYIRQRGLAQFYYLGTALSSPIIDTKRLHKDLTCDRSGLAAWQKLNLSETHIVTVALNRVDYTSLNRLRTSQPTESSYTPTTGKLSLNTKDFLLFLNYPFAADGSIPPPPSAPVGRLYYSAYPQAFREADPNRSRETTVSFECNPLWYNSIRKWKFLTEDPTSPDWPNTLPTPT